MRGGYATTIAFRISSKLEDLALDGRGVKPRVLVADQSITQLENVKDPDLDRCPTTLHTRPFLLYVACQERLVDNKTAVLSGESPDRLQTTSGMASRIEE